jgi:hypothetical protein
MSKYSATSPNRPVGPLVARAQRTLGLTHERFGKALAMSKRTAARWSSRGATPTMRQLHTLARLVHPRDAELAEEIASAASETLESLGIVAPPPPPEPPPPPPAPPPPPPPAPPLPVTSVVEAVVCAAADALNAPPSSVRAALFAAFQRARELRLSVEDVEGALRPAAKGTVGGRSAAAPRGGAE